MEYHLIAELEENYDRFIERVLSGGQVWAVKCDDGLLTCLAENGEQPVIPFWSDAAYARRAAKDVSILWSVPTRQTLKEALATGAITSSKSIQSEMAAARQAAGRGGRDRPRCP